MLPPISTREFAGLLRRCKPEGCNFRKIGIKFLSCRKLTLTLGNKGVAFSGGSDSFTLLHLLNQLARTSDSELGLPAEIYAITIDHQLQTLSSEYAIQCAGFARKLNVPHMTMRIDWGSGVFPPKPESGMAFEALARDCRYRQLFDAMTKLDLDCLAMGHHLDDQIETMVMRHTKGTRGAGLAAMRPCRRWGMGSSKPELPLAWFGLSGMKRWIVRPLLTIHKVSIASTSEAKRSNSNNRIDA
jgi:tRNA(Ile)-lysidine synthetase-like protein